jgi:hypothetical protein
VKGEKEMDETNTKTEMPVIGYFCWWSLNGVKVSRADLQGTLDKLGIEYAVPEIKDRSAFLKAVREVRSNEKNKGLLVRKISKDGGLYAFGLVDEAVDQKAKALDYAHSATLMYSTDTSELVADQKHRAFDMIKKLYEEYREYLNADDVRDILLDIVRRTRSIGVRQRGGIYFIHETHADLVGKLEALLDVLPGDNAFMVAPQIDQERTKRAIYKAFISGLKDKIAGFEQDLDEGEGLKQRNALVQRVEQFKEVRAEIEFYRDALHFQADELAESLDRLKDKLTKRLNA